MTCKTTTWSKPWSWKNFKALTKKIVKWWKTKWAAKAIAASAGRAKYWDKKMNTMAAKWKVAKWKAINIKWMKFE